MAQVSIPEAIGITLCLILVTQWMYEKTVKLVGPWGAMGFFVLPPFFVGAVGYIFSPWIKLYVFMLVVIIAIIVESYIIDNKLMEYFPRE